jgi:hypothetical protein
MTRLCLCGHTREAHRHYRSGTDCGLCGCLKWRPAPSEHLYGTLNGPANRDADMAVGSVANTTALPGWQT